MAVVSCVCEQHQKQHGRCRLFIQLHSNPVILLFCPFSLRAIGEIVYRNETSHSFLSSCVELVTCKAKRGVRIVNQPPLPRIKDQGE